MPLQDDSPCPIEGVNKGKPMSEVPDYTLVWYYEQGWLKSKYPEVYEYIVRNAHLLEDLELKVEDC